MPQVLDKIGVCMAIPWRNIDRRDPRIAEYILVHRNEVAPTPEGLMDFFKDVKNGTGGRFPYHFFVYKNGDVAQCAPLGVATPGACGANRSSIQIVLDGDFRTIPPTTEQAVTLQWLVAEILKWKPSLKVEGHTDQPGRSTDPKKICPGKFMPTGPLRIAALDQAEREQKDALRSYGVKF